MVWAKNGTPDTLGSAGDTLTISDLTANTFNVMLTHQIPSGSMGCRTRLDNDSGSNYAGRYSFNGGGDGTLTSQTQAHLYSNVNTLDEFDVAYIINMAAEEKLMIGFAVNGTTSGAGTAPSRGELVSKWVNTSDQFTRIDAVNLESGDADTGSNLSALGSDGTESITVQDGAIYYDTDLNKEYVLYDNAWTEV